MDGDLVGNRDRPEGLTRLDLMKDLAFGIRCGDLYRYDQLRYRIRNGTRLGSASWRWRRTAALLSGNISSLQDVIDPSIGCLSRARSHMAIRRVDRRAHVIRVRPGGHDLIDAHASAAHCKVFSRPYDAAATISSGRDSTAHIPNMPGHIVGCHGCRRRLGNRINNGVFDEGRE